MSKHWRPAVNEVRTSLAEDFEGLRIETKLIGSRLAPPDNNLVDPLVVPIYYSSTYKFKSVQEYLDSRKQGGYEYQRDGNPTQETAEIIINELDEGKGTLLFNSGLAAMNAIFLTFLKQGDHIVCQRPCYSGTYKFIQNVLTKFGVEVSWVKAGVELKASDFEACIKPNTTLLYGETPCNPTMSLLDLKSFGEVGAGKVLHVIDSTFASPMVQKPINHGIELVFHSCTKYMGGHSDLIGGCVTTNDVELWRKLKLIQTYTGSTLSAMDSYFLVRGLKTLHLRMEKHCENALELARFLELHPKVKSVWYPGLESHPQHELAKTFMTSFGGMISFEMENAQIAQRVVENVRLIHLAVSLGGVESLIEHPATMTHGPMIMSGADDEGNVPTGLIRRLSVGIENVEDLKTDLNDAIDKA